MFRIVTTAALLVLAGPALAQDDWQHAQSGITIPGAIGGMRRSEPRDLSGGAGYDVMIQFGTDQEPATLYIYRSAYPNPALWFERTRLAMNTNVGSGGAEAVPRSFTLRSGTAPNGMREEIELPAGGPFRTTAVALAQLDEWIVKVRVTSSGLDRAGISARMDTLLDALRLPAARAAPHPLQLPALCTDDVSLSGVPASGDRDAVLAGAMATGMTEFAEARGFGGLAAEPDAWCRETTGLPSRLGSAYRRRDGSAWVALVGDSGMAVSGRGLAPAGQGAATFASTARSTRVAEVYDDLPDLMTALNAAAPVLIGRSPGLVEISVGDTQPRE
ncbi:hypothetical protein RCO27_04665 [Sphingosinicella sp. LHD-64]|uniref:hypothetical protein n=1 Tax=Sphingosinicella sp. LHD-64 TaxID=3072139 RepID=UPI00280CC4FB|nr:hypothetical protein [Sphingosinicella sp. LHD-64]MDQ8755514.1 hypothetical protein [Sphingosinicella sp. LHD-64]